MPCDVKTDGESTESGTADLSDYAKKNYIDTRMVISILVEDLLLD